MAARVLILESSIEKAFVRKAKALGCITRKMNGQGFNAWPDRLVLIPGGATVFIEFKKPGEDLRPLQQALHDDAAAIGHKWFTCDNVEDALKIIYDNIRAFK
jgi:hypothetical protein